MSPRHKPDAMHPIQRGQAWGRRTARRCFAIATSVLSRKLGEPANTIVAARGADAMVNRPSRMRRAAMPGALLATISLCIIGVLFIDRWLARSLADVPAPVMGVAAVLGALGTPALWIVSATMCYAQFELTPRKRLEANQALFVLLSTASAILCAIALQLVLCRSAPDSYIQTGAYSFLVGGRGCPVSGSFPSLHAAVAAALAMACSVMMPIYWPTFAALAFLVGASRTVVGGHFFSDVVAGFGIGILAALAVNSIFSRLRVPIRRGGRRIWS